MTSGSATAADIDPVEAYEWAWDELRRLEEERERLRQRDRGDLDRRLDALLQELSARSGYLQRPVVPSDMGI